MPPLPLWNQRKRFASPAAGFSLVEVVIALAVITFCLLPIMGLLGVASQQAQSSEKATDLTLILQSQQSILGAQNFDTLKTQVQATPAPVYYYAAGGRCLNYTSLAATATPPTGSFYKCTVQQTAAQRTADQLTASQQSAASQNPSSDDRIHASLTIQYPAPGYAKKESFILSFFRYGTR